MNSLSKFFRDSLTNSTKVSFGSRSGDYLRKTSRYSSKYLFKNYFRKYFLDFIYKCSTKFIRNSSGDYFSNCFIKFGKDTFRSSASGSSTNSFKGSQGASRGLRGVWGEFQGVLECFRESQGHFKGVKGASEALQGASWGSQEVILSGSKGALWGYRKFLSISMWFLGVSEALHGVSLRDVPWSQRGLIRKSHGILRGLSGIQSFQRSMKCYEMPLKPLGLP